MNNHNDLFEELQRKRLEKERELNRFVQAKEKSEGIKITTDKVSSKATTVTNNAKNNYKTFKTIRNMFKDNEDIESIYWEEKHKQKSIINASPNKEQGNQVQLSNVTYSTNTIDQQTIIKDNDNDYQQKVINTIIKREYFIMLKNIKNNINSRIINQYYIDKYQEKTLLSTRTNAHKYIMTKLKLYTWQRIKFRFLNKKYNIKHRKNMINGLLDSLITFKNTHKAAIFYRKHLRLKLFSSIHQQYKNQQKKISTFRLIFFAKHLFHSFKRRLLIIEGEAFNNQLAMIFYRQRSIVKAFGTLKHATKMRKEKNIPRNRDLALLHKNIQYTADYIFNKRYKDSDKEV